ncbi:hypothetical protein [Eikenella corrodens]|uniref:hypothetical protein n=1 Tax=Eikenella corrodens TaxID=539 RepID=UPI00129BC20E|nr:hypothetical protein [Eikenella corrodens]
MQKGALSLPKFIPQIKRILFSGSLYSTQQTVYKNKFLTHRNQFYPTYPARQSHPRCIPDAESQTFLNKQANKNPMPGNSMGKKLERVTGIEPA